MKLFVILCVVNFSCRVTVDAWIRQSGSLKQIAVSEGIICGVNSCKQIFCATTGINTTEPTWISVPGPDNAKQVALYGREMVLVTDDMKIKRAYYKGSDTIWVDVPGALKQISIDHAQLCGTTVTDSIYCTNYNPYTLYFPQQCDSSRTPTTMNFDPTYDWRHVPGGLSHLVVRAGRIFGVTSAKTIYYGKSNGPSPYWTLLSGMLDNISYDYDYGRICGIKSTKVYCATENIFNSPTSWVLVEGALDNLELWGNAAYGTFNGQIYYNHF